jgi:ABC-type transporter Mla subunit MlaD
MALQDLTPQLRTRLSRMERAVGFFVSLAVLLLTIGFGYYLYNTAKRKGWFLTKAPYFTITDRATGLKIGDPVTLMGFDAGRITDIQPMPAEQFDYNVYVEFELRWPNYGYMWTEGSHSKVATADLLGKRVLEVTKGTGGYPTYVSYPLRDVAPALLKDLPDREHWVLGQEIYDASGTNFVLPALAPLTNIEAVIASGLDRVVLLNTREPRKGLTGIWNDKKGLFEPFTRETKYWLLSDESPAVTERMERLVGQVEKALPNIFALTNQLLAVLANSASLTSNLNEVASHAVPAASNLSSLTAQLTRPGALGEMVLPTNLNARLDQTLERAAVALSTAQAAADNANTNLATLAANLNLSLQNLAGITSNLNSQVAANTNLLEAISKTITDADTFVQGLKRHWLLRSAFRDKETNAPALAPPDILRSPKDAPNRP